MKPIVIASHGRSNHNWHEGPFHWCIKLQNVAQDSSMQRCTTWQPLQASWFPLASRGLGRFESPGWSLGPMDFNLGRVLRVVATEDRLRFPESTQGMRYACSQWPVLQTRLVHVLLNFNIIIVLRLHAYCYSTYSVHSLEVNSLFVGVCMCVRCTTYTHTP